MSGLEDATEPAVPGAQPDHSEVNSDTASDPQVPPVAPVDEDPGIGNQPTSAPEVAAATEPESTIVEPEPVLEPAAEPVAVEPAPAPEVINTPEPAPTSDPGPAPVTSPTPDPGSASEVNPAPEPAPAPEASPAADPSPASEASSSPDPTPAPEVSPVPDAPAAADAAPTPVPDAPAAADAAPTPAPDAPATAEPAPAPTADPAQPPPTPAAPVGEASAESSDGAPPPPSAAPRPRPVTETGKIVEGLVTAVSSDGVELTLDDGRQAVITRRNFGLNDEDPSTVVSVGDKAHGAELLREDPKGRVVLSRSWALKRQAWEKIVEAASENKLLTGKVMSASKKGLVVDVGVRGFIPSSHLELEAVADMAPYVGQSFELKILEVDPRREKLVLSRRSLLLKAQRKEMQEMLSSLKKGEVRTGTVSSLADYGAFVDLGGVNGLVHISELSWKRVSKPSQVVSVGDQVEVKILDVKPKKKRISLSIRQITPDPLSTIEVGVVQTGRVTRLVDYGAFVAIGDFEGLVHLSELAEYRVSTPEEIVAPGDEVGVKVLSVDTKRRRIELSIRRAAEYGG